MKHRNHIFFLILSLSLVSMSHASYKAIFECEVNHQIYSLESKVVGDNLFSRVLRKNPSTDKMEVIYGCTSSRPSIYYINDTFFTICSEHTPEMPSYEFYVNISPKDLSQKEDGLAKLYVPDTKRGVWHNMSCSMKY